MMSKQQRSAQGWLDEISWSVDGLVPVVVQDVVTHRVIMFAWMNREAITLSMQTGEAHYWSRSRHSLWRKGEESGHVQKVKEARLDCDGDVLLLNVEQQGGIACHTGRESCFFRRYENGHWTVTDGVLKSPEEIYPKTLERD